MITWFNVKICYGKMTEKGMTKKVTESYLVDAMTFTEAEARITGEMAAYERDIKVMAMSRTNIQEVFNSEKDHYDKWYRVIYAIEAITAKGKKKKERYAVMIKADCTATAEKSFHERMKDTAMNYTIEAVQETDIVDVYFYSLDKQTDATR